MKRILIAAAACLGLAACGAKPATFQVEAPDFVKGQLTLCGKTTPMKQTGNVFSVDQRIACSGTGEILLTHKTGPQTVCQVQSATPGFPGVWKFVAQGPECALESLGNKTVPSQDEPARAATNAPGK